jgi:NAD-dependent SIR2 family protein deacetylase
MTTATVLFGAGATKALGGPITEEILPHVLGVKECAPCGGRLLRSDTIKQEYVLADEFLRDTFNVPDNHSIRELQDYPPLPLLMTLIDQSILSDERLTPEIPVSRLRDVRDSLLTIIYDSLSDTKFHDPIAHLTKEGENPIWTTLARVAEEALPGKDLYDCLSNREVAIITTNYDTHVEDTMFAIQAHHKRPIKPAHYGCKPDFGPAYPDESWRTHGHFGVMYKLHGSLAWGYCSSCRTLFDEFTDAGKRIIERLGESAIDTKLSNANRFRYNSSRYNSSRNVDRCAKCRGNIRLFMLAPSVQKAYHNLHIARVWARAEIALRESTHWYLIGYSLPSDDFEIARLLLRSLKYPPRKPTITIVQKGSGDTTDEIKARFTRLLGRDITYTGVGCENWGRGLG